MFYVFTVFVLDTEVVNDEGEVDVAGFVFEESIGAGFVASVFLELLAEVVVGDLTGFFESVPGFAYFGVAASFVNALVEVVLFDDARWDFIVLVSDVLFSTRGQK